MARRAAAACRRRGLSARARPSCGRRYGATAPRRGSAGTASSGGWSTCRRAPPTGAPPTATPPPRPTAGPTGGPPASHDRQPPSGRPDWHLARHDTAVARPPTVRPRPPTLNRRPTPDTRSAGADRASARCERRCAATEAARLGGCAAADHATARLCARPCTLRTRGVRIEASLGTRAGARASARCVRARARPRLRSCASAVRGAGSR